MSSSASSEPAPPQAPERRRRGREIALAILAFCAAPTVAAWFAYFVWQPQSRTNYGELIEPRPLSDPEMRRLDGGAFHLSQMRGMWVLLQVDSGACGESCRRKLVYMRQARRAQGKDADRIERVWLIDDAAIPDRALLDEHAGLKVALAPSGKFLEEISSPGGAKEHIYVLDPVGNVMLRFPADPDGRRMIKDLARLLRVSRIG